MDRTEISSSEPEYWTNYHGTRVTATSPYEILIDEACRKWLKVRPSTQDINLYPKHKSRKCFKSKEQIIKVGG